MSWYNTGMYESLEKFNRLMQYRTFRRNRGNYPIKSLISMIKEKAIDGIDSFVNLGDEIPDDIIPIGRDQQEFIDRDYTYYRYSRQFLENNPELQHALIISVTGHEAATAAALAERGIPISWNVELEGSDISAKRVLEMLQDYAPIIENNPCSDLSNMGIIIEAHHGCDTVTDLSKLPSLEFLKEKGIQRCIVLTEASFQEQTKNGCSIILEYLDNLNNSGINVSYVGVGDRQGDKADFRYTDVTHSIDSTPYLSNFQRQQTGTIAPSKSGELTKSLSTTDIGRRTVPRTSTENKGLVEETFEEWKKRMIEAGILKG